MIAIVLLALAPFGYREQQAIRLRGPFDLVDSRELAETIRKAGLFAQPAPGRRVWRLWSDESRKSVAQFAQGNSGQSYRQSQVMVDAMNQVIDGESVYAAEDWGDVWIGQEAKDLLALPWAQLSSEQRQRCNLLVLEAAFRSHFRPRPDNELILTYAGLDLTPVAFAGRRLSKKQFQDLLLQRVVINLLIKVLIGVVALFTAILVTSPIIPQTFATGSLHLLLSKPVNRSLMFLAKFFGGCAFILVNVTFLLVGLWLIAGLRFDVWNQGLLLCIPIFLFLFGLYYSVSSLAGVIWKSPVMCVVVSIVFWLVCFTVEIVKSGMESQVAYERRLNGVVPVEEGFVARNERGDFLIWDGDKKCLAVRSARGTSFLPGRLAALPASSQTGCGHRRTAADSVRLHRCARLAAGKPEDGWSLEAGPNLPSGARRLLHASDGKLLVFSEEGLHEFDGSLDFGRSASGLLDQLQKYLPIRSAELRPVGPAQWRPKQPAIAAADPQEPIVAVYSAGEVLLLRRPPGADRYAIEARCTLDGPDDEPADVACVAGRVLVARANGDVLILEAASLQTVNQAQPHGDSRPRYVCAAPDGSRFAVSFHDGSLWTSEVQAPQWRRAEVTGQGDISGASFDAASRLLVVDRWERVTVYSPQLRVEQQLAPPPSVWQRAFRYVVLPLYAIFPKPTALDETVQYVLSKKDELTLDGADEQLEDRTRKLAPWRPVRDSSIFMAVMLFLACLYVQRQDF